MISTIVLNLGQGNLKEGFSYVSAIAYEKDNPRPIRVTASLPPAPQLISLYRRWRLLYSGVFNSLEIRPRIEIDRDDITNVSKVELSDISQQYSTQINAWLNSPEFSPIQRKLRSLFSPTDSFQITLETNDFQIRRLPWQLWDLFSDYPYAEIALSAIEYGRAIKTEVKRDKIRILAILGHSEGIDITLDQTLLSALPHTEIVFLVEPNREAVNEQLWDNQGWDILFFAGHSNSEEDEETGKIHLNPWESLSILELKPALRKAISRGLQLAIFNSCDGLGLAANLADLHIPQIIVMREPIPDRVAQSFLKYFLTAFSGLESHAPLPLPLAIREAREKLEGLETQFPCASWLPVLCHNPAEKTIDFQELVGDRILKSSPDEFHANINWWVGIAAIVILLIIRQFGFLQPLELKVFDRLMGQRPSEPLDNRFLLVTITKDDIEKTLNQGYPISDQELTHLLQKLNSYSPRVVGLNLYRNSPLPPGEESLTRQIQQQDNLIGICKSQDNSGGGTLPHPAFSKDQVGFNDIVVDSDGKLRRYLFLMGEEVACNNGLSFGGRLALEYLYQEGFQYEETDKNETKIGDVTLKKLTSNAGGYVDLDAGGRQFLINYRNSRSIAKTVTLTEIFKDEVDPSWITDKIIL
ncbi:MAG: CHASE2 domain-containing protein, partial [Halothece sp.]